ncbi:MAG: S-methyl-5-thioribose-1-phosphate isomerase [Candidatus Burarchaeum sp.]|nr:S-methyl-5-thioribose-1-phosphate isomerase [Candidatus Burarchaeum sp.]MDO8339884.1 S-methyl-5-thioribose-1-phosphate isomerase [Candidatus Burarchaeum sp.]
MKRDVKRTISKIKSLRIQGARNVAKAAMQALGGAARSSNAKTPEALLRELTLTANALAASRPTEPMMRNALEEALRRFFAEVGGRKPRTLEEARRAVLDEISSFEKKAAHSHALIAEFGAKEIPQGATVLTHCHSSTVTAILRRAHRQGKKIKVICTETRPLYQGRITARELSSAGIPTTLIVDSAIKSVMHDVDLVLVGADAITSSGELVNKIGTATLAFVAYEEELNFYSAAELFKFDPLTLWGKIEPIEQRDAREVADPRSLPGVRILNPAFDLTPAKHITAYITEHGVVAPQSVYALASNYFELVDKNGKR